MRKIIVLFESGGGLEISNGATFLIRSARKINYLEWSSYSYVNIEINTGRNQPVLGLLGGRNGIVVRLYQTAPNLTRAMCILTIWGDFNPDQLSIMAVGTIPYTGRLEIRNEYGVLITDNGLPWVDGTYPPDAKNRAGLAGLHAAPAAINPELENALMGDVTNKEEELTGAERGAGVQYALERDEDNGL